MIQVQVLEQLVRFEEIFRALKKAVKQVKFKRKELTITTLYMGIPCFGTFPLEQISNWADDCSRHESGFHPSLPAGEIVRDPVRVSAKSCR